MLPGVQIEHEINEGTLESGARAREGNEPATAQLGRSLQIEKF